MTEETASGTLVPAAMKVSPITESGILSVCPAKCNQTDVILIKKVKWTFLEQSNRRLACRYTGCTEPCYTEVRKLFNGASWH